MTTRSYHVSGFKRDDHTVHINVIVDVVWPDGRGEKFEIAQAIAGPDYCINASSNISQPVPDAVKNRLLTNEELYAAVPELNPHRTRHATRR